MTRFPLVTATIALGGLLAIAPAVHAQAVSGATPAAPQQDHSEHHPTAEPPAAAAAQQPAMMAMRQKMMADMEMADAALDALVVKMNAATGSAKVDAIAEALTALVQQHETMRSGMMQMMMPMGGGK